MLPSADTSSATLRKPLPGKSPRPTIPPELVHRNASGPLLEFPWPTITEPSLDIARGTLALGPPERSPRATIPSVLVQRNVMLVPLEEALSPAITRPSAEIALALLLKIPP